MPKRQPAMKHNDASVDAVPTDAVEAGPPQAEDMMATLMATGASPLQAVADVADTLGRDAARSLFLVHLDAIMATVMADKADRSPLDLVAKVAPEIAHAWLPAHIEAYMAKNTGCFVLTQADWVTALPSDLVVMGNLDVVCCPKLTSLSKGLEVGGYLSVSGCDAMVALPDGLRVGGIVDLDCCALERLPKGMRVGGDLNLSLCPALKELPADLEVGGGLCLWGCPVDVIPSTIRVDGDLAIGNSAGQEPFATGFEARKCRNIQLSGSMVERLPGGMDVQGDLLVEECRQLEALPDGLKVKGNLYAYGCKKLKDLPEGLAVGGDLLFGSAHSCATWHNKSFYEEIYRYHDYEVPVGAEVPCAALEHLPAGLRVGGSLDMRGCPQWDGIIPDDARIAKKIYTDQHPDGVDAATFMDMARMRRMALEVFQKTAP